jgi:hypothetical protein
VAEYSGKRQIAVDCRRLRQSRGRSLVVELVEQVDVYKVLRRCPVTIVYLNDIIIYLITKEEYGEYVKWVLKRL